MKEKEEKLCVALGDFDGVHLGHRSLLEAAVNNAFGFVPAVYTFEDNCKGAKLVTTPPEKEAIMRSLGIEIVIFDRFESVKDLSPSQFVGEILSARLNAGAVVCGSDYRFGRGANGDVAELKKLCASSGITVIEVGDYTIDGRKVSSSELRTYIENGDMEQTMRLLGRPFSISGTVRHGKRLGSAHNTPTVNVSVDKGRALPPFGVYASRIIIEGKSYNGVSDLGVMPSVDGSGSVSLETNVFDFSKEIYGQNVTVCLVKFIRPEMKFPDTDRLFDRIKRDVSIAREYFNGDENEKNC